MQNGGGEWRGDHRGNYYSHRGDPRRHDSSTTTYDQQELNFFHDGQQSIIVCFFYFDYLFIFSMSDARGAAEENEAFIRSEETIHNRAVPTEGSVSASITDGS